MWSGTDRLERGDRIGPYTVLGLLGKGDLGWVYLARSGSGRPVAVKTLSGAGEAGDTVRRGLAREIALALRVKGACTVEVVDADLDGPVPWMATAYVAAPSLADLVRACGPLPQPAVRWLAAGVAEGLVPVHQAGLVHRDLKPGNVLMPPDGPRVTDYGISYATDRSGVRDRLRGHAYIAPEQAREEVTTSAADVYSLGSLLFFAATGRSPYPGDSETEILERVRSADPDLTGLPPELDDLVLPCLRADPLERPAPAEIVADFAQRLTTRQGAFGAGAWLPPPAMTFLDEYARRGLGGAQSSTIPVPIAAREVLDAIDAPVQEEPAPTRGDLPAAIIRPAPEAVEEELPPADESPWVRRLFASAVVLAVLLTGGLAGTLVERDRARRADTGTSATGDLAGHTDVPGPSGSPIEGRRAGPMAASDTGPAPSPEPEPPHPLTVFATSLTPGVCVDFASDGSPTWQPVLPAVVECDSSRALQRVLGRADSPTARASCMDVDGRGAWLVPGGGTVCLERLFHVDECVPAQVREGRYWAYLFDKVPCEPADPDSDIQRLRIVAVLDGPKVDAAACFRGGAVHYPLPSRDGGLCAAPVRD